MPWNSVTKNYFNSVFVDSGFFFFSDLPLEHGIAIEYIKCSSTEILTIQSQSKPECSEPGRNFE